MAREDRPNPPTGPEGDLNKSEPTKTEALHRVVSDSRFFSLYFPAAHAVVRRCHEMTNPRHLLDDARGRASVARAASGRPAILDRLRAMRGPGESYSDVILRIAAITEAAMTSR